MLCLHVSTQCQPKSCPLPGADDKSSDSESSTDVDSDTGF